MAPDRPRGYVITRQFDSQFDSPNMEDQLETEPNEEIRFCPEYSQYFESKDGPRRA